MSIMTSKQHQSWPQSSGLRLVIQESGLVNAGKREKSERGEKPKGWQGEGEKAQKRVRDVEGSSP